MVVVLPIVLMLVLAGAYMAWRSSAKSDVEAKLAKIRAAGEPTNGEEANEFYRLPDGVVDTSRLWLKAVEPFDSSAFEDEVEELPFVGSCEDEVPPPGQPWDKFEAAEAILAKYQSSLDLMHEAAAKKGAARYPVDFREGYMMMLEHVRALRRGGKMLRLEARVAARRGDPAQVAESLHAMHETAESLRFEPTMVSQLVRISQNRILYEELSALLPYVDFSDPQLKTLTDALTCLDYRESIRLGLVGERVATMKVFLDPSSVVDDVGNFEIRALGLLPRYNDLSLYLDHMTRMIAATQLPPPRNQEAVEKIDGEFQDTVYRGYGGRIRYLCSALLVPAVETYLYATSRAEAIRCATLASIAVQRYRLEHDAVPESLEQLVPEFLDAVPTDPFDGKPIRYRVDEDQYVIYSVGRDGVDGGGQITQPDPESHDQPPDVGFATPLR